MIYTNIPYAPKECGNKNLGCAYNKFMEMLPNDDDWACFLDHDAMFTTSTWYLQLNDIIEKYPDAGAFTCRTNRCAVRPQLIGGIDNTNHDILYHRQIGEYLQEKYYDDVWNFHSRRKPYELFSGSLIVVKKSAWEKIGGFVDGMFHVDSKFRIDINANEIPFYIMNGVYVYHLYEEIKKSRGRFLRSMNRGMSKKPLDLNEIFLHTWGRAKI